MYLNAYAQITDTVCALCVCLCDQKLEHSYKELLRLGYKREAVSVMRQRADVFMTIARKHTDVTGKHDYMLRALKVLRHAGQVSDDVYNETITLAPIGEVSIVQQVLCEGCSTNLTHTLWCDLRIIVLSCKNLFCTWVRCEL